jgi:hypothetical protein
MSSVVKTAVAVSVAASRAASRAAVDVDEKGSLHSHHNLFAFAYSTNSSVECS